MRWTLFAISDKITLISFFATSFGFWIALLARAYYPTICQALPIVILTSSELSNLCTTFDISKSHNIPFSEPSFKAAGYVIFLFILANAFGSTF